MAASPVKSLIAVAVAAVIIELAAATNHTVGKPGGSWDLSTSLSSWASSITFKSGDNLIFSYSPSIHDVLEVNKANYDSCTTAGAIKTYTTGNDVIPLSSAGKRYFICGVPGHCVSGMKLEIDTIAAATAPSPPPVAPPPPRSPPSAGSPQPSPSPPTSGSPPPFGSHPLIPATPAPSIPPSSGSPPPFGSHPLIPAAPAPSSPPSSGSPPPFGSHPLIPATPAPGSPQAAGSTPSSTPAPSAAGRRSLGAAGLAGLGMLIICAL